MVCCLRLLPCLNLLEGQAVGPQLLFCLSGFVLHHEMQKEHLVNTRCVVYFTFSEHLPL